MTELQSNLLREVAKRMPEVLSVGDLTGRVFWKNDGGYVTERELLHVAAEFEKTMSREESRAYTKLLTPNYIHGLSADWCIATAPFETRAQAWLKVKQS